jgi:hypothetical protein
MLRLFSPFTVSGRFALMLALNMISSGGSSAQDMHDRDHERPGPALVAPANGATVDHEFTVRIGFPGGGGPRGPAEGTGITMDAPPATATIAARPRARASIPAAIAVRAARISCCWSTARRWSPEPPSSPTPSTSPFRPVFRR